MIATSSNGEDVKHRVYVGGIDPSRGLQVSAVVHRIQNRLPAALQEIHTGSTYTQFAVPDADTFNSIRSMLHNVTWKGCKLVVEKARPHFLERLRIEREEVKDSTPKVDVAVAADVGPTTKSTRRHWKVKRRYGEPLYIVDTNPLPTESWDMFSKALKRSRGKKQLVGAKKYSSRYNRSIRLQFTEEHPVQQKGESNLKRHAAPQDFSSSSSDESMEKEAKRGSYVWSDGDSSSSDDDSSPPDHNENDDSDGDVSSERPEDMRVTISKSKPKEHTGTDEFAAALDFDSEDPSIKEGESPQQLSMEENNVDLNDDLDRNMSLLAGLFGGTQETTLPSADVVAKAKRQTMPQMIRFDPTDINSQKNLLVEIDDDDEDDAVGTEDKESAQQREDEAAPPMVESTIPETSIQESVYEQGKLEAVFKSSRELVAEQAAKSEPSGLFSFGFQLAEEHEEPTEPTRLLTTESSPPTETAALQASDCQAYGDDTMDEQESQQVETASSSNEPAMRMFEFPSDTVLDSILHGYYYDGEGERIMNDLQAWRQDPTARETWLKERHALTLDWKNKRKAAVERKRRKEPPSRR